MKVKGATFKVCENLVITIFIKFDEYCSLIKYKNKAFF